MICEPEFLARIMDISTQDAHCMCQVGSGPDGEVDQCAMGSPPCRAQFDIDFGGTVFEAVDDIGADRSGDGSSRFVIVNFRRRPSRAKKRCWRLRVTCMPR